MSLSRVVIVAVIMLSVFTILPCLSATRPVELENKLSEFPMIIDGWNGKIKYFENWVYEKTAVDDSVLAEYHNSSDDRIQLYIGYYNSQKEGNTIHSPRNCMPGSGWNIINTTVVELRNFSRNNKIEKVLLLETVNGNNKQLVLYWYHSRSRIIYSEYFHKIYLIWDAITRKRTDGAFIRLMASDPGDRDKCKKLLIQFAEDILPVLDSYIPA